MAVLKVHYLLLYLPPKYKEGRTQIFWSAYHFCIATKTGVLGANSRFMLTLDGKAREVNSKNAGVCRTVFGGWLSKLATKHCGGKASIVPVPSKDALVSACGPSRSVSMAVAACADHQNLMAVDAIRFNKELAKSSTQQGTRDAKKLYEAMEVVTKAPKGKVILVDDIYTSGAHMRASLKRLEEAGYDVVCGAVCGLTVHGTDQKPTAGVFDMNTELTPQIDFSAFFEQIMKG